MGDGSERETWRRIDRRTYLATTATVAGIGLAGCSGDGDGGSDGGDGDADSDGGEDTPEPTDSPTETDSPTPEPAMAKEWETALGEFRITGNVFSGTYAAGRLFLAIRGQGVYAIEAGGGATTWETTGDTEWGDIEATADRAFASTPGGLVAFASDSGKEAWRTEREGGDLVATTGDLVVRDGGFDGSPVYDAVTGDELRTLEGAGGYHMVAVAENDRLYSGAGANTRSFDLTTGEERWRVRQPLSRQPAVVAGDLVKATDGTFVVYDGETGDVTEVSAGNVGGATAGAAGIAVAIDNNAGTAYGLDPEAGSVAWTADLSELGFIDPVAVGSQFVISAGEGLVTLDATTGERLGEVEVPGVQGVGLVGGESQVYRVHEDREALVTAYSTPGAE